MLQLAKLNVVEGELCFQLRSIQSESIAIHIRRSLEICTAATHDGSKTAPSVSLSRFLLFSAKRRTVMDLHGLLYYYY